MDISPEVQVLVGLQRGAVYYFVNDQLTSAAPHYHLILNGSPTTDIILLLSIATSQVGSRQDWIVRTKLPAETLVVIKEGSHPLFKVDTAFDCNSVKQLSQQELVRKFGESRIRRVEDPLSDEIVSRIVMGVLASPRVSEDIKIRLR